LWRELILRFFYRLFIHPAFLLHVHGAIGRIQDLGGGLAAAECADAIGSGKRNFPLAPEKRRGGNRTGQRLRFVRRYRSIRLEQDDAELIPAQPPDHIGAANILDQDARELLKGRVAGGVAETIVDLLQTVYIEIKQASGEPVPFGDSQHARQFAHEGPAVADRYERVVIGQIFELGNPGLRFVEFLLQSEEPAAKLLQLPLQLEELAAKLLPLSLQLEELAAKLLQEALAVEVWKGVGMLDGSGAIQYGAAQSREVRCGMARYPSVALGCRRIRCCCCGMCFHRLAQSRDQTKPANVQWIRLVSKSLITGPPGRKQRIFLSWSGGDAALAVRRSLPIIAFFVEDGCRGMHAAQPAVGIIMGSRSDWETMRHAAETLTQLGIAHETRVISAHRTPQRLVSYATGAKARGIRVVIAGAGGAAHLPGMTAAMTPLPVLGVPIETAALKGLDSLLSIVQMPGGVPVGTLAIGKAGAVNAALLAAAILALVDTKVAAALESWRESQTASVPELPDTERD
jgi:5-(carboxyamino)imidazole ribonucleotide mutase